MASVSLCMIVKDEEDFLLSSLESVKELVDELIIIDTGSTDRTKQIAKQAGAKVFDFAWKEDFSAARNFSLSKATKDWILVLDADETIALKDHPLFRELLIWKLKNNPRIAGFKFHQRNYTNDGQVANLQPLTDDEHYEEQKGFLGYILATPVRLFRNNASIRYEGQVHEGVEKSILAKKGIIADSGIPLHHFKERKGAKLAEKKRKEYGSMAEAQAKATPKDAKPFYELGLTQKAEGKLNEAMISFKTVIALNSTYMHPYSNLAEIHLRQKEVGAAEKMLLKAIETKPTAADHYNYGLLLMKQKKLSESEQQLRKAIALAPDRIEFYHSLSAIFALQQDFQKALKIFDICIQYNPHRVEPYNALGALIFKLGKYEKAAEIFEKGRRTALEHAQPAPGEYLKLLINLAECDIKLEKKEEAKKIFEELIAKQPAQKAIIEKRISSL